jgi:hypothetical protein
MLASGRDVAMSGFHLRMSESAADTEPAKVSARHSASSFGSLSFTAFCGKEHVKLGGRGTAMPGKVDPHRTGGRMAASRFVAVTKCTSTARNLNRTVLMKAYRCLRVDLMLSTSLGQCTNQAYRVCGEKALAARYFRRCRR